jgi:hypothetical protein
MKINWKGLKEQRRRKYYKSFLKLTAEAYGGLTLIHWLNPFQDSEAL